LFRHASRGSYFIKCDIVKLIIDTDEELANDEIQDVVITGYIPDLNRWNLNRGIDYKTRGG